VKSWLPNLLGFQLVWLAAVAGAGKGLWWSGVLALVVFATLQLTFSAQRAADLRLMGVAAVIGLLLDSAWIWTGLIDFATPLPFAWLAPVWIIVLWLAFALTLNHSMASLQGRPWIAAALGAVGGPLAYSIAVHAWQAASLPDPAWHAYLAVGLAWAIVTPLLLALASRLSPAVLPPTNA
jgi:hypothetical protein